VPESWGAECISDLTTTVYRYPTYYNISYLSSGVPEIRGELLIDGGTIESDLSLFRFIDRATASRFPRVQVEPGDIVMSVRGTMGKIGIVREIHSGAVITANLIRLAPDRKKIDCDFFKYALISERFMDSLNRASPQTTIKTITASDLKALRLPLPPTLEEQREIVAVLDAIDRRIDLHKRKRAVLDELFKALLHKLMTCEIRVVDLDLSALDTAQPKGAVA
jgi:type I restriction enzyme S subunit